MCVLLTSAQIPRKIDCPFNQLSSQRLGGRINVCIICNEKITILLELNGRNSECDFYNMRHLFCENTLQNYYISNEEIFYVYSSVDHFGLKACAVEIKVKLFIYIGLFTQRSLSYEGATFF